MLCLRFVMEAALICFCDTFSYFIYHARILFLHYVSSFDIQSQEQDVAFCVNDQINREIVARQSSSSSISQGPPRRKRRALNLRVMLKKKLVAIIQAIRDESQRSCCRQRRRIISCRSSFDHNSTGFTGQQ